MSRVAFKTLGCRLNQAETAQIAAQFSAAGYEIVPPDQPCDVCVIHTCAVTRRAEQTCMRAARSLRRTHPHAVIVLAGCAAEVSAAELRAAGADLVVGQKDKFELPRLVAARISDCRLPIADCRASLLPLYETTRASIKAQDGCEFRCAYCIVPTTRGAPRSRPLAEVVDEARRLADAGFKEVVLTGANLGCFQDGSARLADLIRRVEAVDGIARIRISSIELSTVERDVIDCMAGSEKLCPFLHLPLQSGDDRVLKAMGRRYTSTQYREAAEYAVSRLPLLGLGADIIVGFPGEDEAAFQNTVKLVEALPFSNLHVFPYSKRPGTRAADMAGQVPQAVKKERTATLIALGERKRTAFAERFVGKTVSVLVERVDREGLATGWTREYVEAQFPAGAHKPNDIVVIGAGRADNGILFPDVASSQADTP